MVSYTARLLRTSSQGVPVDLQQLSCRMSLLISLPNIPWYQNSRIIVKTESTPSHSPFPKPNFMNPPAIEAGELLNEVIWRHLQGIQLIDS